jgi:hypothetical protein
VLACAAVAFADAGPNNYTGSGFTFSHGSGTTKKPVPIGFHEKLVANNKDKTKVAAVLVNITTKIYGLRSNAKYFPTCDPKQMVARKSDAFCPKKSKFAAGLVNAMLGDPSLSKVNRVPCNPNLDVFNGGPGKLWFFFTTHSATQCAGLTTGSTKPYLGKVSVQGNFLVTNVQLPPDVSTRVANQPNFYGSLVKEQLNFFNLTTKVKGKTIGDNPSVGCLKGKRPYTIIFTSTTNGSNRFKQTITGSGSC